MFGEGNRIVNVVPELILLVTSTVPLALDRIDDGQSGRTAESGCALSTR
jgi:hypothetical protein